MVFITGFLRYVAACLFFVTKKIVFGLNIELICS